MAELTTHSYVRCLNRLEVAPDGKWTTAVLWREKSPPRPPTIAQRHFARVIADKLSLSLPAVNTFRAYWLFIHDHADEFYARARRERDF